MVQNSIPLSKKIGLVTEPIIALKRTAKIKPQEEVILDLIISVGEDKEKVIENVKKYKSKENVKKEFELSRASVSSVAIYVNEEDYDNGKESGVLIIEEMRVE